MKLTNLFFWKKKKPTSAYVSSWFILLTVTVSLFLGLTCWDLMEIVTWENLRYWNFTKWLNSPLFYLYIFLQIFVGLSLDFTPPSRLCFTGFGLSSLGALFLLFSWIKLGKLALCLGTCFLPLSSIMLIYHYLDQKKFAFFVGLTFGLAMLAPVLHQFFFILDLNIIQFLLTFFVIIVSLGSMFLFFKIPVKEKNSPLNISFTKISSVVFSQKRQFFLHGFVALFLLTPIFSFVGFWLKPFLLFSSYSTTIAYSSALVFYAGLVIGMPLVGFISDRFGKRRPLMLTSPIFAFTALIPVVYVPLPSFLILILMGLLGIFSSVVYIPLIFAVDKREDHPGFLLGLIYFMQLLGVILLHFISTTAFEIFSARISTQQSNLEVFNIILTLFPLSYLAAFIITLFLKEDAKGNLMRIWRIKLR